MILRTMDPLLIAEVGINHGGNLKKALRLVDAAKRAGATAVKFQTYSAEKRVKKTNPAFNILKKCELKFSEFKIISKYCKKKKIIFFSTPFDIESVDFLNKIKVPFYKVASFDIENYQLLNAIIKIKKPIIFSTGMAKLNSIKKLSNSLNSKKIEHSILHCVSSYPNNATSSYLKNLEFLKKSFRCSVGLSDHTNDIKIPIYSYLMGANIIEKHFKLIGDNKCVDAVVSIDEKKFRKMSNEINEIKKIFGKVKFGIKREEKSAQIFLRKKIY